MQAFEHAAELNFILESGSVEADVDAALEGTHGLVGGARDILLDVIDE